MKHFNLFTLCSKLYSYF